MQTIHWGILGTGQVANDMAREIALADDSQVIAVSSRTKLKTEQFSHQWNIPHCYTDYRQLLDNPAIDIVYIATPHSSHYELIRASLLADKHVLCEKPLTINAAQTADCIALAKARGLFLMEAMWMRFFPAISELKAWLKADKIGDVRLLEADLCLHVPYDPQHRLYNSALGGGALLDMGIYPLSLATTLLGFPETTDGSVLLNTSGVDELDIIRLSYANGAVTNLSCSMRYQKPMDAYIVGSKGHIKIHERFINPARISLHIEGMPTETFHRPFKHHGYLYQITAVNTCIRQGKTESELMPLNDTLQLIQLMDSLRKKWGIQYPGETNL